MYANTVYSCLSIGDLFKFENSTSICRKISSKKYKNLKANKIYEFDEIEIAGENVTVMQEDELMCEV